jgi:hypothetical protein
MKDVRQFIIEHPVLGQLVTFWPESLFMALIIGMAVVDRLT